MIMASDNDSHSSIDYHESPQVIRGPVERAGSKYYRVIYDNRTGGENTHGKGRKCGT